ncbi:MAG: HEAT repeat domain-containing protein [Gemmataceae bacterium]|nr:HEAT repeat domain-containing protein [Gemmataceae bacterium]
MSIAVLTQVYDEARRLAVAGSVVARGDFRLKKLLPPLEQAGAKAPVIAKVAECAKAVVEGTEEASAENLLELTSLVTAVLYTQGETGMPGTLEPIETVDLGGAVSQTSARVLMPLLEALSSTGSGRLELVKDAAQRGLFRDLRLVKPALAALDDPYPEIVEFVAEKVLPLYGRAILPELRAKFDLKGTKGHPRRLKLMHALDPAGTRELVKQALDGGSKEVKVAAVSCLGADREDLAFLVEQAGAKAQDVRQAAFEALSAIPDPAAAAAIEKALAGKDLELVTRAVRRTHTALVTDLLVARVRDEEKALVKEKDRKKVSAAANRLVHLIQALPAASHPAADALTLDLFARRAELAKAKGEHQSGSDVVEAVVVRMANGPKPLRLTLARAHAELEPGHLGFAFHAARAALPPAEVFGLFAPHVAAGADEKKKGKDRGRERQAAVLDGLGAGHIYWHYDRNEGYDHPLDPRWLDLAVQVEHLGLVHAVRRPGHAGAEAFVWAEYEAQAKKVKQPQELADVLTVLVHLPHPRAAEALVAAYERTIGKTNYFTYWFHHLAGQLPKSAVPRLEAVTPKLKDRELDQWVDTIQRLKDRKDPDETK